jgi:cytochrome c553
LFRTKVVVFLTAASALSASFVTLDAAAQVAAAAGAPAAPPPPLAPLSIQGDAKRGSVLAETCKGCHGVPGAHNAYPSYYVPKLGGQNLEYIEIALQGYRRGTRSHPTMQAQASSLSDQDIADLATFFSTWAGEPETGKSDADAHEVAEGKQKAMVCLQCHGEVGVAAAKQWPNLAGQHLSYLEQAMHQYKTGQRSDLLMAQQVAALDDATIAELAAFFSAQAYLHQTAVD